MKSAILTLLLLGSYVSKAQDFAPVGAKWHFGESYAWSNNVGFITYECLGDTIIGNLPCRTIYKSNGTCCIPGGLHFLHQRNDSIFVFDPVAESFDLIIDFGAETGESWIMNTNPEGNLMSDSATCNVDSVYYFHYSATDSLRVLNVTLKSTVYDLINGDTYYTTLPNQIIEKIGFRDALLLSDCIYFCDVNFEDGVRCYEDVNVGLITFSNVDCEYTPVEEIDIENEISIYPNPAGNTIYVESNALAIDAIELFSPEGKQILVNSNTNEVDVSSINAGVYFIRVMTERGITMKSIVVLK